MLGEEQREAAAACLLLANLWNGAGGAVGGYAVCFYAKDGQKKQVVCFADNYSL